jgi:hypothetical protein
MTIAPFPVPPIVKPVEQWAPRVDRVLGEQLQRLKGFVEGKSPAQ